MKLKKCKQCNEYTLKEICAKCKTKTLEAHYKFLRIRDAPRSDVRFFKKN